MIPPPSKPCPQCGSINTICWDSHWQWEKDGSELEYIGADFWYCRDCTWSWSKGNILRFLKRKKQPQRQSTTYHVTVSAKTKQRLIDEFGLTEDDFIESDNDETKTEK